MDGLSRQGWLVAGGGAVCAAAFAAVLYQAGVFGVLRGAAPVAPQAPVQSPAQSPAQTPASPQAAAPQPALPAPGFDIARVEPNGDAVIAGRAAPGAQVTLIISGKPGGQAQADANGQFVILPKALPPGAHELSLLARTPQGEIASNQSIAVLVPQRPSGEVVVALAEPGKPTA
ncbi:MAG: peptidoglycan-binding protein, partial [Alphaproteobacteria bacterium]|nr:peptidoglycan-binding protein [Alphaproteobacteria bacterium]